MSTPEKGPSWQLDNSLMCKLDVLTCVCFSISRVFPCVFSKRTTFPVFLNNEDCGYGICAEQSFGRNALIGEKKEEGVTRFFFQSTRKLPFRPRFQLLTSSVQEKWPKTNGGESGNRLGL